VRAGPLRRLRPGPLPPAMATATGMSDLSNVSQRVPEGKVWSLRWAYAGNWWRMRYWRVG
jgi:hypothetical protein